MQYLTDDGLGERLALSKVYRLTLDTTNAPRDIAVDRSAYDDQRAARTEVDDISVDCSYDYPRPRCATRHVAEESRPNPMVRWGRAAASPARWSMDEVVFPLPGVALPPTRDDPRRPRGRAGTPRRRGRLPRSARERRAPVPARHRRAGDVERRCSRRTQFTSVIAQAVQQQQASIDGWRASGEYREYVAEKQERGEEPLPAGGGLRRSGTLRSGLVAPVKDVPLSPCGSTSRGWGPGELPDVASSYWAVPDMRRRRSGRRAARHHHRRRAVSSSIRSRPTQLVLPWLGEPDAVPEPGDPGYTGALLRPGGAFDDDGARAAERRSDAGTRPGTSAPRWRSTGAVIRATGSRRMPGTIARERSRPTRP